MQCWVTTLEESCNAELLPRKSHAMLSYYLGRVMQCWATTSEESCNAELLPRKSHAMLSYYFGRVIQCWVTVPDSKRDSRAKNNSFLKNEMIRIIRYDVRYDICLAKWDFWLAKATGGHGRMPPLIRHSGHDQQMAYNYMSQRPVVHDDSCRCLPKITLIYLIVQPNADWLEFPWNREEASLRHHLHCGCASSSVAELRCRQTWPELEFFWIDQPTFRLDSIYNTYKNHLILGRPISFTEGIVL